MWPGAHRNIAHKTQVALALGKRRLHTKTSHYPDHKRGAEGHLITHYTIIITSHCQNSTTLCRIKSMYYCNKQPLLSYISFLILVQNPVSHYLASVHVYPLTLQLEPLKDYFSFRTNYTEYSLENKNKG